MNLNEIENIIKKAKNYINEEMSKLPKEEVRKAKELEEWAKGASIEELREKMLNLKTEMKDAE